MTALEKELCEQLFAELEPLHAPLVAAAHLVKRALALGDQESWDALAPILGERMARVASVLSRYPEAAVDATLAAVGLTGPVFAACRDGEPGRLLAAVERGVHGRRRGEG